MNMNMNMNFANFLPGLTLFTLLALAIWHDIKTRRIPNGIVFTGTLAGLALNTLLPAGSGLFSEAFGGIGSLKSLAGLAVGLALLLPMYAMRAMGAGDVKLMAMVGAFMGPQSIVGVALFSIVAGGVLALAVAVINGQLVQVIKNVRQLLQHSLFRALAGSGVRIEAPPVATGKLAYAIAIATGTALYIYLSRTQTLGLFS
jgi:prepilin peptidase CpaA